MQKSFEKTRRFHVHYTLTHSSRLNRVARWFAVLFERKIKRASHRTRGELERDIRNFLAHTNDHPMPFIRTKSANQIPASIRCFCQYTRQSQGKNFQ